MTAQNRILAIKLAGQLDHNQKFAKEAGVAVVFMEQGSGMEKGWNSEKLCCSGSGNVQGSERKAVG